jgi:hypothetical protein
VSKIYVDGCSLTYGQGLDRKYSVGNLLNADIDKSRPGKSNTAMVTEIYPDIDLYDIFIIGFTFPVRYTLYNDNMPIEIQPGKDLLNRLIDHPIGEFIEKTYSQFFKVLWSLTNEEKLTTLTDFYINSLISLLKEKNKKYVIYSWGNAKCSDQCFFLPTIPMNLNYRISKSDSHLNIKGMIELVNQIKEKL